MSFASSTMGALYPRLRQFKGGTPAEMQKWQADSREHLATILIGPLRTGKVAPQAKEELILTKGSYDLYRVTYNSSSSRTNYALISIPRKAGKHPVLLALHGHECATDIESFTRRGHIDDFYGYFAERGFMVVGPHVLDHQAPVPAGATLLGVWLNDVLRCLDYVAGRKDADMSRVGSVGLSTGGFLCLYAAALDERIGAAVPAGAYSTMKHDFTNFKNPPGCDCGMSKIEGIRDLDYCDVAGLVAPRALLVMHGKQDTAYYPGTDPKAIPPGSSQLGVMDQSDFDNALDETRRLYGIFGKTDCVDIAWHSGGHQVANESAYAWVTRHLAVTPIVHADIKISDMFNHDMVLQREVPVPIWGTATPGEHVEVALAGQILNAVTDTTGNWRVIAPPMHAGGPHDLAVRGDTQVLRRNIMVGDVWVCGGLAGMRANMAQDARAFAQQVSTNVRLLVAEGSVRGQPIAELYLFWKSVQPGNVPAFSAVGMAFGDALQKQLGIPIGLIQTTANGSVIESWIPHEFLATNSALRNVTEIFDKAVKDHGARKESWTAAYDAWHRNSQEQDRAGLAVVPPPALGSSDPRTPPSRPSGFFNGIVAPLAKLPVKGVIWYGGESEIVSPSHFPAFLSALVAGWRTAWRSDNLPFLFVEDGTAGASGDKTPLVAPQLPSTVFVPARDLQGPDRPMQIGRRGAETAVRRIYAKQ